MEFYTEWTDIDVLISYINSISKNFAYTKHDSDIYGADKGELAGQTKKEHIHYLAEMSTKRTINGMFQLMSDKSKGLNVNLIEVAIDPAKCARYLTHIDYPEKYQYNYNKVITNNHEWYSDLYHKAEELDGERANLKIASYIQESDKKLKLYDILQYAHENHMYNCYRKNCYQIKQMLWEHNEEIDTKQKDQFHVDREKMKAYSEVKKENSAIAKVINTFDRAVIENENGELIEIMNTGRKFEKQ